MAHKHKVEFDRGRRGEPVFLGAEVVSWKIIFHWR